MNKAFDALLQFHEDPKIGYIGNGAGYPGTLPVLLRDFVPGIIGELFDAQRESFMIFVNVQDNGLHFLTLLINLRRMFDSLGPGNIGNMHQTVDTFIDTDKNTEVGNVFYSAFNGGTDRIFLPDDIPRIGFDLLESQGDALVGGVDVKNHALGRITYLYNLGWMPDLSSPGHLRYVNQALDALFHFHERAVIGEAHDFAYNPGANGVLFVGRGPGISFELFQPERNPAGLLIKAQHLYRYCIAQLIHL